MSQLTLFQRYEISFFKKQALNNTSIAKELGVLSTTIKRELKRNSDRKNGVYHPKLAQRKAELRHSNNPKSIHFTKSIKNFVIHWLKEDYSPEQIVGVAKRMYVECVSVASIINLFG